MSLRSIATTLWGKFSKEEIKTFGFLALTAFCIIGTYVTLKALKDPIFMRIVGRDYIPYAKMLNFILIVPMLLFYAKLVDWVEHKHRLFYILCAAYAIFFIILAYFLSLPVIGLSNTMPHVSRLLGWVLYFGIESFGTLAASLFWSYVDSITLLESAKRGYPFIIMGAQSGAMFGSELAKHATSISIFYLFMIVVIALGAVALVMHRVARHHGPITNIQVNKKRTGAFEGLKLLLTRPYLIGIFVIATTHEIIHMILEYQLMLKADLTCATTENVIEFFGFYHQTISALSLAISLIGASFLIRRLGISRCLIIFPTVAAITTAVVWFKPTLWMLFGAMVIIKGTHFAFNAPCREILFIPTSNDIKFKAKSWIDGFGDRLLKGVGSGINAMFASATTLMFFGPLIALGIASMWLTVALAVGKKHTALVEEGKIVE